MIVVISYHAKGDNMTYRETKTEQNQTLSNVPLNIWGDFKVECAKQRMTMTEGFIKAFKLWEANNVKEKESI